MSIKLKASLSTEAKERKVTGITVGLFLSCIVYFKFMHQKLLNKELYSDVGLRNICSEVKTNTGNTGKSCYSWLCQCLAVFACSVFAGFSCICSF